MDEMTMYREMQTNEVDSRRFHRGQWVDAKDTIDQWVSEKIGCGLILDF
jgi:hypothetical protein